MLQRRLDNEKDMIEDLKRIYEQASKDCADKIAALSARTDMENLQSIIYQKQYQQALKKQIDGILELLYANEFEKIADYLNMSYEEGFVETLYSLHQQGIPLMFPIDQNAVVKAIQTDSKISTTLYSRLGEDIKALKTSIRAEISRGIVAGLSYNEIAKNIASGMNSPFNKAYNNALRISRTEGNRVANQATMDACYNARDKGADVVKSWDSTLDGKTRESHRMVDGEIKELDEKFSNGLMFPCDPAGGAAEVINCRCALLQDARWALEGSFTKMNNFTKEIMEFDSRKDYENFKKEFWSKENVRYMNYTKTLEERYKTKNWEKILDKMTDREYKHYSTLLKSNPIYKAKGLTKTTKRAKISMQFFAESDMKKQESGSLKRAIRKYQKRIAEHQQKINEPQKYVPDWDTKSEQAQNGLKRHWQKEIRNFQTSIDDRIAELKERGDYDD